MIVLVIDSMVFIIAWQWSAEEICVSLLVNCHCVLLPMLYARRTLALGGRIWTLNGREESFCHCSQRYSHASF